MRRFRSGDKSVDMFADLQRQGFMRSAARAAAKAEGRSGVSDSQFRANIMGKVRREAKLMFGEIKPTRASDHAFLARLAWIRSA